MIIRLLFLSALFAVSVAAESATRPPVMLLVHGAWGGAWQFSKVEPLLREQGFDVRRATLTGLGERVHLSADDIGLETHIEDVVNLILFENLRDIILVGHSYGGMVISGVADRVPARIARLIYLDALLPNDGDSVATLRSGANDLTKFAKDGFIIPWWVKADKSYPQDVPHPLKTFTDTIALTNPAARAIPATYILTVDSGKQPEEDDFAASAARARERGWPVVIFAGDHNPHWRKPEATAALLGSLR
ncbi:MAG: alpha/beta fold hydrolase [Candidatus Didemnitutus sp.]|nr:alpha/beta fold hydrolase [Candidatus Didemnitutus sp.]